MSRGAAADPGRRCRFPGWVRALSSGDRPDIIHTDMRPSPDLAAALRAATLLASLTVAAPAAAADPAAPSPPASRSGIPYVSDAQAGPPELVEAIRARRPRRELLNLDRMLLHSPAFAKAWNGMFGAIRGQLAVPARLRELAIMAIGTLNRAEYEWAQHEGEFLKAGGTPAQLAKLRDVDAAMNDAKAFDEAERATLALTTEMTRAIEVSKETMARIRAVLPDAQVVELVGTIAGYNMVSRFAVATGLQVEAPTAGDAAHSR
jgi:alkylhydroperoxidase family enzyme